MRCSLHLRNGHYDLIEIKLGGDELIEDGCKSLIKLSKQIDTEKMSKHSFLMVLTANGNIAYRNDEGIFVVPISTFCM